MFVGVTVSCVGWIVGVMISCVGWIVGMMLSWVDCWCDVILGGLLV